MEKAIKDKINKLIEDEYSSIESEITGNQYEPSERGAGTATREEVHEDSQEGLRVMVLEILKLFGINESMEDYTFDEILKEVNCDNFNLDSYSELKELETTKDADSDPKYVYKYTYYLHMKENRTMELCVQDGGEHADNFMHLCEVKKVERIVTSYESIKSSS